MLTAALQWCGCSEYPPPTLSPSYFNGTQRHSNNQCDSPTCKYMERRLMMATILMGTWQHLLHKIFRRGAFGRAILSVMYWIKMRKHNSSRDPSIEYIMGEGGCQIDDEKCYFGGEINYFGRAGRRGVLTVCTENTYNNQFLGVGGL